MDLRGLVDELAATEHGLIMVMGKGGVGKTTIAAAVAVALAASRESRAPDHHRPGTTSASKPFPERVPNLKVSHIDPKEEVRLYRERMLEAAKSTKSAEQLALLTKNCNLHAMRRSQCFRPSPAR